jgi:23S rRNA (guanine745-N1)-methyltransferase
MSVALGPDHGTKARALDLAARFLFCPQCGASGLTSAGEALRCGTGHSFDIARSGYVNL